MLNGDTASESPIVILTAARSGSTLLRLLLDKHPDIACPPETNIVKTAARLGSVWRVTNNKREDLSTSAAQVVRAAVTGILKDYLSGRGKIRFCDKSLGTVEDAAQFLAIFPDTKFICLHRHCMDVVYSGIEACPWGVAGYGFDPYVSASPGNNVASLAHYWADQTAAIADFEEDHQDICHRVHYEALVTDTQTACRGIASFLGVAKQAWDWQEALRANDEMAGAADYKVWSTGSVTTESVGRGVMVPLRVIPPPLLAAVNHQLGRLGYPEIGSGWNQMSRADVLKQWQAAPGQEADSTEDLEETAGLLSSKIEAGLARLAAAASRQNRLNGNKRVVFSAYSREGEQRKIDWLIDLEKFECSSYTQFSGDTTGIAWFLAGELADWKALLNGHIDLAVALRRGNLRILNQLDAHGDDEGIRISLAASILGLRA